MHTGTSIAETTRYINLKTGLICAYQVGQTATGPLLPLHALGAARGKEDRAYNHQHRHT